MPKTLNCAALRVGDLGPVDLEVGAGECVVLGGASGTGKTRMLRAIADLDPHEGELRLGGQRCAEMPAPEWRRSVGYLPAEPRWWRATVGEHFSAGAPPALVERLGFAPDAWSWPVGRLSSGETQRLALARLLLAEPRALLLDEPTAHLDDEWTGVVEAVLAEYRGAHAAPVLWVTHDIAQAARVATRRLTIRNGALEAAPA